MQLVGGLRESVMVDRFTIAADFKLANIIFGPIARITYAVGMMFPRKNSILRENHELLRV